MSPTSFLTGIETVAAKGEADLNELLTAMTTLQAALQATPGSLVLANVEAALAAGIAFVKLAITDTTPFVAALQTTLTALSATPATPTTTAGH